MAITRTLSGTIFRTTFLGSSAPPGSSPVVGGSGAVTFDDGCEITNVGGQGACLYCDSPLPEDLVYIIRTTARVGTAQSGQTILNMVDAAALPTTIYSGETWNQVRFPFFDYYTGGSPGRLIVSYCDGSWDLLVSNADVDTDYLFELESDGTSLTCRIRDAATLAVLGNTAHNYGTSEVEAVAASLYALLGGASDTGWQCADNKYTAFEIYRSHNVSVTGLSTGNAVRLYDASDDTVLASAVESGGTATLDCETVDWIGLTCYLVVYEDDTYATEIARSNEMSDASGGDEYEIAAPAIRGNITVEGGTLSETARVNAYDLDDPDISLAPIVEINLSVAVQGDGSYSLEGVVEGHDYLIYVTDFDGRCLKTTWYGDVARSGLATPITASGVIEDADITAQAGDGTHPTGTTLNAPEDAISMMIYVLDPDEYYLVGYMGGAPNEEYPNEVVACELYEDSLYRVLFGYVGGSGLVVSGWYDGVEFEDYEDADAVLGGATGINYDWGGGDPSPRIDSITPNTSDNNSTIDVTLAGDHFREGMTIALISGDDELPASLVRVVSEEEATCTFDLTGVAAGSWDVVVINDDAQSDTLAAGFTVTEYVPPVVMAITAIEPESSYQNRSILMTITGTGFEPGDTVQLTKGTGAIPAVDQTVISATQIDCSINIGVVEVGLWDIVVSRTSPAQSATLSQAFEIKADPRTGIYLNSLSINDGERYAVTYEGWGPRIADLRMTMRDSQLTDGQDYMPALSKNENQELPLRIKIMGESKAALNRNVGVLLQELRKPSIRVAFYPTDISLPPFFYDAFPSAQIGDDEYWSVDYQRRNIAVVTASLSSRPGPRLDWHNNGHGLDLVPVTGVNDSFERGLEGWVASGTGEITVTSAHFAPDGGGFSALMTNDAGEVCILTDEVARPVNPRHHHNLQIGVKEISGDINFSVDVEFFDADDMSLGTLALLLPWNPVGDLNWLDAMLVPFNHSGTDRYGKAVITPSDIPADTVSAKLIITNDNDGGAGSVCCVDAIWFGDTEYVVGHQYSGVSAFNIPPGIIPGDCAVPADIYFSGNQQPNPWARYDAAANDWRSICGTDANWMLCVGLGGKIIFGDGTTWVPRSSGTLQHLYGVTATDHTHAWACGGGGVLLFYNGASWQTHTYPSLPTLVADGVFEEWTDAHHLDHWNFAGTNGAALIKGTASGAGYSARIRFPSAWQPVVPDAGFETFGGALSWHYEALVGGCSIGLDTTKKRSGAHSCLCHFQTGNGSVRATSKSIGVSPLGTYTFGVWQRSECTTGTVHVSIKAYNAQGTLIATRTSGDLKSNVYPSAWVQTRFAFTVPSNTASIRVVISATGIGVSDIWFDDATLTFVPTQSTGTVETKLIDVAEISVAQNYTCTVATRGTGGRCRVRALFYDASRSLIGSRTVKGLHMIPSVYTSYSRVIVPTDYPSGTEYVGLEFYAEDAEGAWAGRWIEFSNATLRLTNPTMRGIHAVSPTNVIAVGDWGTILNSTVLGDWTPQTCPVNDNLNAVHAFDDQHIIAVGDSGTVLTNDGDSTWHERESGTIENLTGVVVLDGCAYAIGSAGSILYSEWGPYDACGVTWRRIQAVAQGLHGICEAEGIVFTVGAGGAIWSNESGVFTTLCEAGRKTLRSIYMSSAELGWVVGDEGSLYVGINETSYLALTNIIVGQALEYDSDYSPIAQAVPTTKSFTRRLGYYEPVSSGASLEFAFNAKAHRGKHLPTLGALLTGDGDDEFQLQGQLKTIRGATLTPLNTGQAAQLGVTGTGKFHEMVLATDSRTRWDEIDLPTHWTSPSADLANVRQILKVTAPELEGGGSCGGDCLTLIPCDRGYCEVWDILTTPTVILDSHGNNILFSADGTIEAAAVLPSSQTHQAPRFFADPQGMNLVIGCWDIVDGDERLTPRPRIKLMFQPQFLVAPHD